MNDNEYQCAMCRGIFSKGCSDEEARREAVQTFGKKTMKKAGENTVIVCDDCWNKFLEWHNRKN